MSTIALLAGLLQVALAQDEPPPPDALEAPVPVEAPSPEEADGDGLARIQALEEQVAALQQRAEEQQEELARQQLRLIPKDKLRFDVEGFYRTRGHVFTGLSPEHEGAGRYLDHRLRIRPVFNYRDLALLKLDIDGLENVVWGDNASLASTALFSGGPSSTGFDGRSQPTLQLERAWMELVMPVGQFRVGRMPSNWGLGLLANGGDEFDDWFGDNRGGSTVDRIVFATRPIAIAQTIAGKEDSGIPLFLAFGVDRLVEEPLIGFNGYRCVSGISWDEEGFDPRCDANDDGVTDLEHGYTDDSRTEDQRSDGWWADNTDDVAELIFVLIYRGEDIRYLGAEGDLTVGTYVVYRTQDETESEVLVLDGFLHAQWRGVLAEGEVLHIGGTTRAIALPGAIGTTEDPLYKTADIWGYVARLGYQQPGWKAVLEHGYASGDPNVADADFTGRPLHSDYNVGLLLYEQVLARVTAQLWTETASGLWSNGGVYNSRYLHPAIFLYPFEGWDVGKTEVIAAFLVAWPDEPDGAIIRCRAGEDQCEQQLATASIIGWEVDFAVKHRWHEHLLFSLELGWAHATDRLPLETAGLNPEGNFFTLQSRVGWEF
ncbi:MAG: hypothetical protein JRJ84_07715 [Deltaproteobacteria bacterium]|nr:hypothetical protein [Deltaproteobacteria bacterium]